MVQDDGRTEGQTGSEIAELRRRIAELEAAAVEGQRQCRALREDQERFRRLYENAPLGYQSLDADGCFLEVNQAWRDTLGYSRDEIIGKWFGNFLVPHQQEAFRHRFPCFKRDGAVDGVEFGMVRKDGSTVVVVFNGRIGYDAEGNFRQTHCIMTDISTQKRAQEVLAASEARFRTLVANIPEVVYRCEIDPPWWAEFISEPVLALTGHEAAEFMSREVAIGDFVVPEDVERVTGAVRRGVGKHEPYFIEYRVRHRDGSIHWAYERGQAAYDDQGTPLWLDGAILDVTDRKCETEHATNLAKFPSENPNPVLRLASDGRVLYANAAAQALLGDTRETDTPRQDPRRWRASLARALESGAQVKLDEECDDRTISLIFAPVVDADYVNVYGRDVTDRKRAEEERRQLEAQIQHTQKLESLGVLAGGIAHDFNNLLMAILGNADLALMDLSPVSPARQSLAEIKKASLRAADLAKQMLAYSGKGKFVVEPLDLSEVVEEMAHILEVSVSKKAVLKYDFSNDIPAIEADATQVRQVVMNLITNASEAIGDKSGIISIRTGAMQVDRRYLRETYLDEDLPEGLYVTLEVADTGSGMDAETQAKLFDPFFTTKFTGRGLGMAAVLGIVRGHSGAIKVYSEIGRGTTVKVLLPAVEGATVLHRNEAVGQWQGSGTVLLVDDEETVRAIGTTMLQRLGMTAITAVDGRDAVAMFREHVDEIGCVILDLTMPRMDGEQAFRELRRIRSDVRVIMSSGYNEQEVTQRFAGKGIVGFIQKPYELQALAATLREALAR